jgi:hypothetical protein
VAAKAGSVVLPVQSGGWDLVDYLKRARLAAKKRVRFSGVLEKIVQLPREVKAFCDGCGFASPWLATTTDRYGLPTYIAVCPRCALVSQVVRFTPESAASFYNGLYRPLVSAFHGTLIDGRSAAAEAYSRAGSLSWMLGLYKTEIEGKVWVDVGGGQGLLSRGLWRKVWCPDAC